MRKTIMGLAGQVVLSTARAFSTLRSSEPGPGALVIAPTTPGSVGDAAMIQAARLALAKKGFTDVDLLSAHQWTISEPYDHYVDLSALSETARNLHLAEALPTLSRYRCAYMIGADVLDGVYGAPPILGRLKVVHEVARRSGRGVILGSSFSKTPNAEVVAALRNLPASVVICARDPISRERMEAQLERPIRQTADMAFLIEPDATSPVARAAIDWIRNRRAVGDRIVGININHLQIHKDPELLSTFRDAALALVKKGISILLVPHDTRGEISDMSIARDLTAVLDTGAGRVHLLEPENPSTIRAVLEHVDILATGRMHAAILAMGGGTPALSVVYQGKFEGLYRLMGLEDEGLLIEPDQISGDPAGLERVIVSVLARADELQTKVTAALDPVRALARGNFDEA